MLMSGQNLKNSTANAKFSPGDITIVILSRGRELQLTRTIQFWRQTEFKTVIIHNTTIPLNLNLANTNVNYIVSQTDYAQRSTLAASSILTKYAILCADDELFIPSGLIFMGQFLEENSQFLSVGSGTVGVASSNSKLTLSRTYQNMIGYKNIEETIKDRLTFHTIRQNQYRTGSMYRLMRVDVMQKMLMSFSQLSHMSTPYIYEVTAEIIVNGLGKTIYLDDIYWVRNWVNKEVAHTTWDRRLYFYIWWEDDRFELERTEWYALLQRTLGQNGIALSLEEILFDLYKKRKLLEIRELRKSRLIRNHIPAKIKNLARQVIKGHNQKKTTEDFISEMAVFRPARGAELEKAISYF
jgi:hypothetical protein